MSDAPTYTIRNVSDFLLVPEERLDECLREFRLMLGMAHATLSLLKDLADETIPGEPDAGRFELVDKFEWIDDGLGNVTLGLQVEDADV